jgi:hypothetical protein
MAETFLLGGRLVTVADDGAVTTNGAALTTGERRGARVLSRFVRRGTHAVVADVVTERSPEQWPSRTRVAPDPEKRARVLAERAAAREATVTSGNR